jgi:hypothetical protein
MKIKGVIPAQAGIQDRFKYIDSCLRRNDEFDGRFLSILFSMQSQSPKFETKSVWSFEIGIWSSCLPAGRYLGFGIYDFGF